MNAIKTEYELGGVKRPFERVTTRLEVDNRIARSVGTVAFLQWALTALDHFPDRPLLGTIWAIASGAAAIVATRSERHKRRIGQLGPG